VLKATRLPQVPDSTLSNMFVEGSHKPPNSTNFSLRLIVAMEIFAQLRKLLAEAAKARPPRCRPLAVINYATFRSLYPHSNPQLSPNGFSRSEQIMRKNFQLRLSQCVFIVVSVLVAFAASGEWIPPCPAVLGTLN